MNIYQDNDERLSTIYESPSPQHRIEEEEEDVYDDAYDKLIVYDIADNKSVEKLNNIYCKTSPIISPSSSTSSYRSPLLDRTRIRSCYTDASFKSIPTYSNPISASNLCGTTTMITSKVFHPPMQNNDEKSSSSPVINNRNIQINKSLISLPTNHQSSTSSKSSPISLSVPVLLLPVTTEQNTSIPSQHIQKMKVIQSSSSSLSDFIMSTPTSTLKSTSKFIDFFLFKINFNYILAHYEEVPSVHHSLTDCSSIPHISYCAPHLDEDLSSRNDNQRRPSFTRRILTNGLLLSHCSSSSNPTHRRIQPPLTFNQQRYQMKPKSEEKLSTLSSPITSSSSSSESNSPSGEKFISRSDYLLQQQQLQQQNLSQQRKASSLKTISDTTNQQPSKILYPIDFQTNNNDQSWYNKVPTSDSGIVIDTAGTLPTSKSSIEEV
jgi:hypothetical protein